jgi:endonuclease/exonuclease/phosphatase family metal-dependent hydrolase
VRTARRSACYKALGFATRLLSRAPLRRRSGQVERFDRICLRDGASASLAVRAARVLGDDHALWSDHAPLAAVVEVTG